MNTTRIHFIPIVLLISLFLLHCAVPRYFWSEKDIPNEEIGNAAFEKRLLIASSQTDFKYTVVEKLKSSFSNDSVYVKVIGLSQLKDENCSDYSAVLLITTCVARGIDRKADKFLSREKNHNNIIVLTTSGDGEWLPEKKKRHFDAIASASEIDRSDAVADTIMTQIRSFL